LRYRSPNSVYIELGDRYRNVITWLFRELTKTGGLQESDILIATPNQNFRENQKVIPLREDWMFHPGELVEVEMEHELPKAVYLPSEAVLKSRHSTDEYYYVYIVKNVKVGAQGYEEGMAEIRKIIKKKTESLWSVERGLEPGDKIIIHGAYQVNNRYEAIQSEVPVRIIKNENATQMLSDYTIISESK
jgi:hypothetical protein